MNWRQRSGEKEMLDGEGIPFPDLLQNLKELDAVNTLLGGHATTRAGLRALLVPVEASKPLHVAEIGCGGGDNLRIVHQMLTRARIPHRLTGVDLKPECIQYARQVQTPGAPIDWQCSDYRDASWPEPPDVIFSSLFCHHFTDAALVEQLRWLAANSRLGFFINDLHRHPVAYHAIRWCTRLFSKSYLVRNDAPLSVQRGFQRTEWMALFRQAGLYAPSVRWRWAFRHLIVSHRHD